MRSPQKWLYNSKAKGAPQRELTGHGQGMLPGEQAASSSRGRLALPRDPTSPPRVYAQQNESRCADKPCTGTLQQRDPVGKKCRRPSDGQKNTWASRSRGKEWRPDTPHMDRHWTHGAQ